MNKLNKCIYNRLYIRSLIFVLALMIGYDSDGQTTLTHQEAYDLAKKNNHQLKSDRMVIAYKEMMIKTANDIAPTDFVGEIGQVNSAYFDTRFSVSQAFLLPKVYKQKRDLYKSEKEASVLRMSLSELEIKQQLDRLYLEFDFVSEKINILTRQDSLFNEFLNRATLRLKSGESNILEKNMAEMQKSGISLQIDQLRSEVEILILEFNLLVNDGETHFPKSKKLDLLDYNILSDSANIYNHPSLLLTQQNIHSAKSMSLLAKSALLPSFSLGYANMSIRGTGADNINYSTKTRFSSVQIGASIPILTKSIKANIEAAKVNESILEMQFNKESATILKSINQLESQHLYYLKMIDYYKKDGLINVQVIRNTANSQFNSGDINFMDYVLLLNQTLNFEIQYAETIKSANDIAISLFYIKNNY